MSLLGIFDNAVAVPVDGFGAGTDIRNSVTTDSTYIDTTFTNSGISETTYGSLTPLLYGESTAAAYDAAATVYWLHFATTTRAARPYPDSVGLYDSSNVPIWVIRTTTGFSDSSFFLETYNDAGVLQTSTEIYDTTEGSFTVHDFDISFDPDNDEVRVFKNGTLDGTYSINISTHRTAATQISRIMYCREASSSGTSVTAQCLTQIIFADEETIGWKIAQLQPTANGTNNDESGSYTNIDENGLATGDLNTLVNAGTQTFEYQDMPDLTALSLDIVEVFIGTVADADAASAAPNLTNQMYISSTLYDGAGGAVDVEGDNYSNPVVDRHPTNPNTAAAWTESDLNNAEFGYKTTA